MQEAMRPLFRVPISFHGSVIVFGHIALRPGQRRRIKREGLAWHHLKGRYAFPHQHCLVNRKVPQHLLLRIGGRPTDAYFIHARCGAHADVLLHRISAEARHRTHCAKHFPLPSVLVKDNLDTRAVGGTVALYAGKFERDRMPRVSGIAVERALVGVTNKCAAHLFKNIFLSAVLYVGERDGMPLLQMTKTAGGGHVLKANAAVIAKHAIGQEGLV